MNRKESIRMSLDRLNRIKGCLYGGAIGDALGYPVEFLQEGNIFRQYGDEGIHSFVYDTNGKSLVSDDTQMTLFTANGLLIDSDVDTIERIMAMYLSWYYTQKLSFDQVQKLKKERTDLSYQSWLLDITDLFDQRAPGITCLSALEDIKEGKQPYNHSKGCGGIMRVAPIALFSDAFSIESLDLLAAKASELTHLHSLGTMPSAVLVHILHRIVFSEKEMSLKEIILEARDTIQEMYKEDPNIQTLTDLINQAVLLSENTEKDLDNIHQLGEGWVAEETLAIALYCSLRYEHDFSKGVIVSVNHKGDSDSTGAVTGNILGALTGYQAIDPKWKKNLELSETILEIAEDLYKGKQEDMAWNQKYKYGNHVNE